MDFAEGSTQIICSSIDMQRAPELANGPEFQLQFIDPALAETEDK